MNLIFIGAPGTGKGTHSERVAKLKGIPHISTGEILRDNISRKTPIGMEADGYISKGNLVPDELAMRILKARLKEGDCINGFILDGFPRTLNQALELDRMLEDSGRKIDWVINLLVPEEELKDRLLKRRVCSVCHNSFNLAFDHIENDKCPLCGGDLIQREDDTLEVIEQRFVAHKELSGPILSFYKEKGILICVRSCGSVEETHQNVMEALQKLE